MLEVEGVSVQYGAVRALEDVSLTAEVGAITTILGANGAGKTTLLRAMSGLVHPRRGTISFDGRVLTGRSVEQVVRAGIAHVPEGRGVIEELTVEENLRLGSLILGSRSAQKAVIAEVLDLFPPLRDARNRYASSLSGGERQMLAIARALASRPKALLLDEPSLGLAPIVTARLMAVLRELSRSASLTIILVEQNARSALSIAQSAVVLNLGRVVAADTASTLAADTNLRHHYLGF
ncbi:MAG: ABC transporter ATP-binding protein [Actinomycetota bacterium]|nr:ABC transporter ATP-binding protein [Actinomycetota bacterium]